MINLPYKNFEAAKVTKEASLIINGLPQHEVFVIAKKGDRFI